MAATTFLRASISSSTGPSRHNSEAAETVPAQVRIFFCRKIAAGDLAQVIVHVPGADGVLSTLVIHVLKKFLAGKLLTCPNDPGNAPVFDLHNVYFAALPTKMKF